MTAERDIDPDAARVDEALASWRQGDCTVGERWFVHRFDPEAPLTAEGRAAAGLDVDFVEASVAGLVVVTQTCDIVRNCIERPYIEVSPLVEVDERRLHEIERGRRPAFALLPLLASRRLVADLDRTMTVEKPVAARWLRTPGWTTDAEGRAFSAALARKRVRFAFPDDFTDLVSKLHARLAEKHDKQTDEGRGLRALREIRVQAGPSWEAGQVSVMFWFITDDRDANFNGTSWVEMLHSWLKLTPAAGRFLEVNGQVTTLEEMLAADYVDSDPLDLDHLSSRSSG